MKIQKGQLKLYKNAQQSLNEVENVLNKLNNLLNYKIEIVSQVSEVELKKLFYISGGNSGLSEEFIYNNQPANSSESIPILSSATIEDKLMGYVSRYSMPDGNNLKIFNGPSILVTRNGYAGTMSYLSIDEFTTNDHAYVLTPKARWADKINLRWSINQYQELFYNLVTSKTDNATFNKNYAGKQKIKLPEIKIQNRIAKNLFIIDSNIDSLKKTKEKLEGLIEHEII